MYLRALKYFINLPAVYNSPPNLFVTNALFYTSHNVLSFNICLSCAKTMSHMSIVFISRCL
jgi:hypothetical protein